MRIQEWYGAYLKWLKVTSKTREIFDNSKITMTQSVGSLVSYDADGIKILASLIDNSETADMDMLEAEIPLIQAQGDTTWGATVRQLILLIASIEYQEDFNRVKLQAASDIVKKAYMKRDSLALKFLQSVHVYTSDKCEYLLESKPNMEGKAVIHFIGKWTALSVGEPAHNSNGHDLGVIP